jgi:hypothetical protein
VGTVVVIIVSVAANAALCTCALRKNWELTWRMISRFWACSRAILGWTNSRWAAAAETETER